MGLTREERLMSNWEGMLKWWGAPDSHGIHHPPSTNLSEEEEYWLKHFRDDVSDPAGRVNSICAYFNDVDSEDEEDAKAAAASKRAVVRYSDDDDSDEEEDSEGDYEEDSTDPDRYYAKCYKEDPEEDSTDPDRYYAKCYKEDPEDRYIHHHRTPQKKFEDMLDELKGYADSLDLTQEIYLSGGIGNLLYNVMYNRKHPGIRAKAAEVVSTMVHNNPGSQELIMEFGGLKPLLHNFISDPDVTSRTKALGAISSLIRNNQPGIAEFRLENCYEALRDALRSESLMFQREALNLIQYLLHENSSDCDIVTELGLPHIMMDLTSGGDDADVREAALRCLLVLARYEGGNSRQLLKNDDKLKQVLQKRIEGISAMAPEDVVGAVREERQLVDSLWSACYNDPSSLRMKRPLVLPPDQDAPASEPPDTYPSVPYPSWKRHCPLVRFDPPSPTVESN